MKRISTFIIGATAGVLVSSAVLAGDVPREFQGRWGMVFGPMCHIANCERLGDKVILPFVTVITATETFTTLADGEPVGGSDRKNIPLIVSLLPNKKLSVTKQHSVAGKEFPDAKAVWHIETGFHHVYLVEEVEKTKMTGKNRDEFRDIMKSVSPNATDQDIQRLEDEKMVVFCRLEPGTISCE